MKKSTKVQKGRSSRNASSTIEDGLKELHEHGSATIQGISFDLKPNELLLRGWEPEVSPIMQLYMFGLRFPWHLGDLPEDANAIKVTAGDRIVARTTEVDPGDDLDHPSDRQKQIVTFILERAGKEILVPGSVTYHKRGTFSAHMDADYKDVIRRLSEKLDAANMPAFVSCMGSTKSADISNDQARWEEFMESFEASSDADLSQQKEIAFARRALLAAIRVDFLWIGIRYFLNKDPAEFDHSRLTNAILSEVERLANAASSVGYWLAKSEFAPHRDDTKEGRRSKDARSRGGQTRRDQIVEKAAKWRGPALAFAQKERSKPNSKFGQKALAKEILKQQFMLNLLAQPKGKLPETDSIIAAIKSWEDDGLLPVSAHKRALAAGGIKQPK